MTQTEVTQELIVRVLVDRVALDVELATGGRVDRPDKVEHGRLTATGRSSDHDKFASVIVSADAYLLHDGVELATR